MILLTKIGIALLWAFAIIALWRAVTAKSRKQRSAILPPVDTARVKRGAYSEWHGHD